ncbi:Solute Carrier Organic Anion Transporter Family Member 6A1 [Manis pentadactyla]|nr:Solute Carrier Organic Anion Transporter Family Member 6A1 [Manis pentadactyla]
MVRGSEMPVALCCSGPEHAVAASLRPLSKAFEGEPWGRREDGSAGQPPGSRGAGADKAAASGAPPDQCGWGAGREAGRARDDGARGEEPRPRLLLAARARPAPRRRRVTLSPAPSPRAGRRWLLLQWGRWRRLAALEAAAAI